MKQFNANNEFETLVDKLVDDETIEFNLNNVLKCQQFFLV